MEAFPCCAIERWSATAMRARKYSSLRAWKLSAWAAKGARAAERIEARRADLERKLCAEGARGLHAERDDLGVGDLV
jgi:hypothetical protein